MNDNEPEREILTELVLRTFRLNGLFLQKAEELTKPAGLTAAWWQVLGAVLPGPATVSEIGRTMGLSRQAVQRVANLLVEHGMCELRPNPAHARAKLLAPTAEGWQAIARLRPGTVAWAQQIEDEVGTAELTRAVELMQRLIEVMEHGPSAPTSGHLDG
ncbi:MAG: MarR family winged helix-turn-helix transcriptional regulator [Acidimicrobiales bacterium]